MSNSQRIIISIYIPITILILALDRSYPYDESVQYTRYAIMVALSLSALAVRKRSREQHLMALSFFFLILGDFFLVISWMIESIGMDLSLFGMLWFMAAYSCLIAAYQKNFKLGRAEILTAIPITAVSGVVYSSIFPFIGRAILIPTAVFGLLLSYMVWTAVATVFRGYFTKKASGMIAVSGVLMYICDIGISYSLFHPYYSREYIPGLKNLVWAAYIMGWALLALVINEEELKRR